MYIGISLLSFVWRVSPSIVEGKAAWLWFPNKKYSMERFVLQLRIYSLYNIGII